jgi:hypothetical protein
MEQPSLDIMCIFNLVFSIIYLMYNIKSLILPGLYNILQIESSKMDQFLFTMSDWDQLARE